MTPEAVSNLLREYAAEKSERGTWDTLWQDIADWMLPARATFTRKYNRGDARDDRRRVDTTAEKAIEDTAAGLHGMFTSRSQRWFYLRPAGAVSRGTEKPIKLWLDAVMAEMYGVLNAPQSQFHSQIDAAYQDLLGFGTTVMFDEEVDMTERGMMTPVVYRNLHLSQCYPRSNRYGVFDGMFVCYEWTLAEVVKRFGIEALDDSSRKMYEAKPETMVECVHAVAPRDDADRMRFGSRGFPWASVWVLAEKKHVLSESGYREFPYQVARWRTRTGEKFGVGPGLRMLPEVKMLNEMMHTVMEAAQLAIRPPLQAPDRNFLGPIRFYPNSVSYYRSGTNDRIEPITTGARPDIGIELIERQRMLIREGLFADAFGITEDSNGVNVKATFTMQRRDDQFRRLSPIASRLDQELFAPLIGRLFAILQRAGRIPPAPEGLDKVDIDYVSPVARAMRTTEADDIFRLLELAGPLGEIDPGALANIDADAAIRVAGTELFNVPASVMRSPAEVKAIRQAQQEQKQQEQALVQGGAASAALRDAAAASKDLRSI